MEQVLTRNLNFGFDIPTYYIMEKWSMEIFFRKPHEGESENFPFYPIPSLYRCYGFKPNSLFLIPG